MQHPYKYTMLQGYIPLSPEMVKHGSNTETFRLPVSNEINKFIEGLPALINTISTGKDKDQGYEVKSHSLTFAPDGRILILSILLCHTASDAGPH